MDEVRKFKKKIIKMKHIDGYDYSPYLNKEPASEEEIMTTANKMKIMDYKYSYEGKTSGNYYFDVDQKHISFLKDVSKDFMFINGLHFKNSMGSIQIKSELISFMIDLFNGDDEVVGSTTSGGTESIFVGVYGLREWGRANGITKPKILAVKTAHPAIDKACYYLDIELVKFSHCHKTGKGNFKEMVRKIDGNTIGVYMSGINYPHGIVDDVQWVNNYLLGKDPKTGEINEKTKKKYAHVGIFVDGCLGGFFTSVSAYLKDGRLPVVDFRLEKVFTITCDPHKYAMSPKGCSVVLFRNEDMKLYSMFSSPNWPGGAYATSGLPGSHPCAPIVGAWASLKRLGMDGIIKNYKRITGVVDKLKKDISEIPELQVIGDPVGCVIAFNFSPLMDKKYSIIILNEILTKTKQWGLGISSDPIAIRMTVTKHNCENIETSLGSDLKEAIIEYKKNYSTHHDPKSDSMVVYGTVVNMPGDLSKKIVKYFLLYLSTLEKKVDKKSKI